MIQLGLPVLFGRETHGWAETEYEARMKQDLSREFSRGRSMEVSRYRRKGDQSADGSQDLF